MNPSASPHIVTIPAGAHGADYVHLTSSLTPQWLRSAGYTFVCRYIAPSSSIGKVITPAEIAELHQVGIAISLVYEGGSGDIDGGSAAGAEHGAWAAQHAAGLGYPAGLPIFASADTDVTSTDLHTAVEYVMAFAAALGDRYRIGVYGDSVLLKAVASLSPIGWLPNARSWSPDTSGATIHVRQLPTDQVHAIDPNQCLLPFEAWGA